MQPADTALTRVYNQPTMVGQDGRVRGALYKNPIDCLWKTFRAEGIYGWYKGTVYLTDFFLGYLLKVYSQVQLHTFCASPHTRRLFCWISPRKLHSHLHFKYHYFDHERHHHQPLQGN